MLETAAAIMHDLSVNINAFCIKLIPRTNATCLKYYNNFLKIKHDFSSINALVLAVEYI